MALAETVDWEDESRELALTCEGDGCILWLDGRARRLLGGKPGDAFLSLVVPGTEEKARALLAKAQAGKVTGWEIPLVAQARAATVCFSAKPGAGGRVHLHGLVMPEGYGETVRQLGATMDEMVGLHREISSQKRELAEQHASLARAYRELEESNRGVLALHAELADKADILKRAADVKSRVVANVSHEFRTPLHTILGLSKVLLDASDGPLTAEQEKQVRFIRSSAEELSTLVNDVLDLSKAESGTAIVRPEKFAATDFLSALRGQLRPVTAPANGVELVFEEPPPALMLETDQGKVAQIVRNLITNALKFTEAGAVRVSVSEGDGTAYFRVQDSGIGVAPQDHDRIFEEFGQVESPVQARVKGTGLGLPLSRKLAELLGGTLTLESELGLGSTFTLAIPASHPEVRELARIENEPRDPDTKDIPVLVVTVTNDETTAFDVLDELKADPRTRGIPVVIVTSHLLDTEDRRRLAAETEAILSKDSLSRELAINRIREALQKSGMRERRFES